MVEQLDRKRSLAENQEDVVRGNAKARSGKGCFNHTPHSKAWDPSGKGQLLIFLVPCAILLA